MGAAMPLDAMTAKQNCRIFTDDCLEKLESVMTHKDFPAGSTIYIEGDPADKFYYTKEGTVKLTKTSEDGSDLVLYYFFAGDFFGEINLDHDQRCIFTAEALDDVKLGVIQKQDLEWLIYQYGELAVQYASWLAHMHRYTQLKLRDLTFNGKNGALASVLIRASNTYGIKDDRGYLIMRKFTNNDFARLIGATRETVNRTLAQFKRDGLIETDRGRIRIINMDDLKKICHCEECPLGICRL
jgi:CRP/FNR family cyclic AMP-dependent transcriptional regulator